MPRLHHHSHPHFWTHGQPWLFTHTQCVTERSKERYFQFCLYTRTCLSVSCKYACCEVKFEEVAFSTPRLVLRLIKQKSMPLHRDTILHQRTWPGVSIWFHLDLNLSMKYLSLPSVYSQHLPIHTSQASYPVWCEGTWGYNAYRCHCQWYCFGGWFTASWWQRRR